jgi:hypothetical protein
MSMSLHHVSHQMLCHSGPSTPSGPSTQAMTTATTDGPVHPEGLNSTLQSCECTQTPPGAHCLMMQPGLVTMLGPHLPTSQHSLQRPPCCRLQQAQGQPPCSWEGRLPSASGAVLASSVAPSLHLSYSGSIAHMACAAAHASSPHRCDRAQVHAYALTYLSDQHTPTEPPSAPRHP